MLLRISIDCVPDGYTMGKVTTWDGDTQGISNTIPGLWSRIEGNGQVFTYFVDTNIYVIRNPKVYKYLSVNSSMKIDLYIDEAIRIQRNRMIEQII